MREFFKDCIKSLDTITGIKTYTYLQINAGKSAEAKKEADKEIDLWLSSLCRVSQKFDYIPEEAQQKYILRMMEEDQKYTEFNSRTVWGWLDLHKDKHITHSQFTEMDLSPGTPFDQLPQATKDLVNDFLDKLNDRKVKMTPEEIFEQGQERPVRPETTYISTNQEDKELREKRAEYGRTYCDLYSGRPYPGAPSFEEFMSLQKLKQA